MVKIKNILATAFIVLCILSLSTFFSINSTDAASLYGVTLSGNNLSGYAWSENIGWIGFSGPGYGVVGSGGNLSGYAWNDQIGWLSFNAVDLAGCPSGTCSASFTTNTDGSLKSIDGWARFLSPTVVSGNNGGWVHFNNYKSAALPDGTQDAYVWSDDFGWIELFEVPPVVGICGTADSATYIYASTDMNWGGYTACATGTPSVTLSNSNFPAAGSSFGWSCNTTTCTGWRAPACTSTDCGASTCVGKTCTDNCSHLPVDGRKVCQKKDVNWREVSPN